MSHDRAHGPAPQEPAGTDEPAVPQEPQGPAHEGPAAHQEPQAHGDPGGAEPAVPSGGPAEDTAAPATDAAGADAAAPDAASPEEEYQRVADVVDPATVRRAPRYGRFMTIGVLAGAALALLLAVLPLGRSDLGTGTVLAILLLVLAPLGALLGAVVALVLDRRSMRPRTRPRGPGPSEG